MALESHTEETFVSLGISTTRGIDEMLIQGRFRTR